MTTTASRATLRAPRRPVVRVPVDNPLLDSRAVDTLDELVDVLWRSAAAAARAALAVKGTPEHAAARDEARQLEEEARWLETTLKERPWTEAL